MTVIRTTEIGTVFDGAIVEEIFAHLYKKHEVDSFACTNQKDFEQKQFSPKLIVDIATEKNVSPENLVEKLLSHLLPIADIEDKRSFCLKCCILKTDGRVFRAFVIIRM